MQAGIQQTPNKSVVLSKSEVPLSNNFQMLEIELKSKAEANS